MPISSGESNLRNASPFKNCRWWQLGQGWQRRDNSGQGSSSSRADARAHPGEREAARLPGPWPRADSARRFPDPPSSPPPVPSIPVCPHRPPPAPLTQRASAAYSPRLRGLLAPQATSGFASPGHGARDRRRGAPARAYSAVAELSRLQSPARSYGSVLGGSSPARWRRSGTQVGGGLALIAFAE